jgi:hypothetical protein
MKKYQPSKPETYITITYNNPIYPEHNSIRPAGKRMGRQTASKHARKKIENDFVQPPHNVCSPRENFITNIYFKQTKVLKICTQTSD